MYFVLVQFILVLLCSPTLLNGQEDVQEEPLSLKGRNQACDVLIALDQSLYNHHDGNMTFLVDLAKQHIKGLNQIFASQVFVEQYESYFFNLKRVQVAFGICENDLIEESTNCTKQREAYLMAFSNGTDTSEFCLGYILTYLDFHNGTAGLANVGTVCRPVGNTGFVTMLNHDVDTDIDRSVITLSHEVAHNFNANHDDGFKDNPECYNQGYIMDESLNNTITENKRNFSSCSTKAMKDKLNELIEDVDYKLNCFRDFAYDEAFSELKISVCGNEIVEEGEDCDCGMDHIVCNDPCCYPAIISAYERSLNSTAFPCHFNTRPQCLLRPGLKYGIYVPWAVILVFIVVFGFILRHDWYGEKRLFSHITKHPVRIVK